MNNLHKGKDNIFKDMYWVIRHMFNKNKGVCPRCGYGAFEHGFFLIMNFIAQNAVYGNQIGMPVTDG